MKSHLVLLAAALCLLPAIAPADVILVQETDFRGLKSRTTMSIKGSKVRTDSGTENSVIIDTDTGDMTTLMHEEKMVMTVKGADLKAAAATVGDDKKPATPPGPVATGKKEKFGGYDCEIYTLTVGDTTSTMWVAKDYPGYEKLKKELSALEKMGAGGKPATGVPGMALKTETIAGGNKYITTLVSLKDDKVDEAIFKAPAGYKNPGA